ncbi:MAG: hypothetical protein HQK83_10770 [Fibrobacteria bacterium]|nr:hypothetical protein [Fibrobacteria bacterium]
MQWMLKIGLVLGILSIISIVTADDAASFVTTNKVFAENRLLENRLYQPDLHFLIDGYTAHVSDDTFNTPSGGGGHFIWPRHYLMDYKPRWEGTGKFKIPKKGQYYIYGSTGNEVGDPHLQELYIQKKRNLVPMNELFGVVTPFPHWTMWVGGEQADHLSFDLMSTRKHLADKKDVSWFGGNRPTGSMLNYGVQYQHKDIIIKGGIDKNWFWTTSPVSGFLYPWKGHEISTGLAWSPYLNVDIKYRFWESGLKGYTSGYWSQWDNRLSLKKDFISTSKGRGGAVSIFKPRLSVGYKRHELQMDTIVSSHMHNRFPLRADLEYELQLPDSLFIHKANADFLFVNKKINASLTGCWREQWKKIYVIQGVKARYRNPATDFSDFSEQFFPGDKGRAIYSADQHYNGLNVSGGGGIFWGEKWYTDIRAQTSFSWEWNMPYFVPDSNFYLHQVVLRTGRYQAMDEGLFHRLITLSSTQRLPFNTLLCLQAKWRSYKENFGQRLDYLPSSHIYGFRLHWQGLTQLHVNLIANYVGKKSVRNWYADGRLFTVDSHWENNLSLVQTFLQGKIKLHYTALHAFGKSFIEHPNGNLYRFRIIAGGELVF